MKELQKLNTSLVSRVKAMDRDIQNYIVKGIAIPEGEYIELTPQQEKERLEKAEKLSKQKVSDPMVKLLVGVNQSRLEHIQKQDAKIEALEKELEFLKAGEK